jgi:hypothetical protein
MAVSRRLRLMALMPRLCLQIFEERGDQRCIDLLEGQVCGATPSRCCAKRKSSRKLSRYEAIV